MHWSIDTPAKINPVLRVTGKRADGYHELDTLMVPISLCDRVTLATAPAGVRVRCPGQPDLDGAANLAHRAAQRWFASVGADRRPGLNGVEVTIIKEIPIQAGLGGGSSDAAATLLGLQSLAHRPLSAPALHDLAAGLGADVPFFLQRSACWARGIGDRLTPVPDLPPFDLVLGRAPFGLSTRSVYENLKFPLTSVREDVSDNRPAWGFGTLVEHLINDLQETSERLRPEIRQVCDALLSAGAAGALMSGSGPSVFGIFESRHQADEACRRLWSEQTKTGWTYLSLRAIDFGTDIHE